MSTQKASKTEQLELQLFGSVAKPQSDSSDTESDHSGSEDEAEIRPKKRQARKAKQPQPKPKKANTECVWSDEDDEDVVLSTAFIRENAPGLLTGKDLTNPEKIEKYSSEIRDQFIQRARLGQKPEWLARVEEEATSKAPEEDSDEDEALQGLFGLQKTASKYIGRPATLPKTYIQASKLKDPTMAHRKDGKKMKSVLFHPTEPVLVTANTSGHIQLYRVARSTTDLQKPTESPFLQEIRIKSFKVDSIDLYDDATAVFITSTRNEFFYQYNLMDGHVEQQLYPKNIQREYQTGLRSRLSSDGVLVGFLGQHGELYVFHRPTMEHLHTFMASGRLTDARFSPVDRNIIIGLTEAGEGFIWNLKAKGEQKVFRDEGAVRCTVLKISENGQFIAIGQNTGILNVYELKTIKSEEEPKPLYVFTNLTTSVSFIAFSPDSEMLAFGSDEKPMHYRIAHLQSGTIFKNFPPKNEMLSKDVATTADFSPHSGFVAFGTAKGALRLYRLSYFEKY